MSLAAPPWHEALRGSIPCSVRPSLRLPEPYRILHTVQSLLAACFSWRLAAMQTGARGCAYCIHRR